MKADLFGSKVVTLPCKVLVTAGTTQLSISIRFSYNGDCLLDKTYNVKHKQSRRDRNYEDSYAANQGCLDDMAECLSLATREIVEEISQELNLLMSAR